MARVRPRPPVMLQRSKPAVGAPAKVTSQAPLPRVQMTSEVAQDGRAGLVHTLFGLLRDHRPAVGMTMLAATALPLIVGCSPTADAPVDEAPTASVTTVEAPDTDLATQILFEAKGPSDEAIDAAKKSLESRGVHPDQIASVADDNPAQLVPIADLYRAWASKGSGATPSRSAFWHFQSEAERGQAHVDQLIKDHAALPSGFVATPAELHSIPVTDPAAIARAQSLATDFGYAPLPRDLNDLEWMSDDDFAHLQSVLTKLQTAGGMYFTRHVELGFMESSTDLDRVKALLPLDQGQSVEIGLYKGILDPKGGAVVVDEAALLDGVAQLKAHGVKFTPVHLRAAAVLGGGTEAQQARMDGLLQRAAPPSHVRATFDLARLSLHPLNPKLSDGAAFAALDQAVEDLGRKLSANEIGAVLDALERGTGIDALLSDQAIEWSRTNKTFMYVKDAYTVSNLSIAESATSRSDLITWINANLEAGAQRTDINAEYHELFAPQTRAMSTGELHKIKLLRQALDTPAFIQQLSEAIQADLANPEAEAGGVVRFGAKGALVAEAIDSTNKDDGAYVIPKSVDTQKLVSTFHVHGGHTPAGTPHLAGPSSGLGGTGGDRGDAWSVHQDDIVVTRISDSEINVDFYTGMGIVVDLGNFQMASRSN